MQRATRDRIQYAFDRHPEPVLRVAPFTPWALHRDVSVVPAPLPAAPLCRAMIGRSPSPRARSVPDVKPRGVPRLDGRADVTGPRSVNQHQRSPP